MEVSFEVVSTLWMDYLLILVFVPELWRGQIMCSENATFVKNSISNKQFLSCRELVKIDENHFVFTITQIIKGQNIIFDKAYTFWEKWAQSWWLSFWPPSIWDSEIALRGQFFYFLHLDPYNIFKLHVKQRKFRIFSLLFPETDF